MEQLRQLGGTAKLSIDLVQHSSDIEKAVRFALGNSLVADTLEEAKHLAFDLHHKVAVIDGTQIAVNGSMSGGNTRCVQMVRTFNSDKLPF
jgi:chromosome segregation ATPase